MVAPNLGRACFTSVLSAFQLPKRICRWWRQTSVAALSPLFLQHSSSQRRSADGGTEIRTWHFHICFINILAPKEGLQMVAPKFGRCIFTSVLSAFQLPKRVCRWWRQSSVAAFSPPFISIPTPKEGLQMTFVLLAFWLAPTFGRCIFTPFLSAFQLPKKVCRWLRQSSAVAFPHLFPAPKEGPQMVAPKFGRCIFTPVFTAFQLPKRICSEWRQKSVGTFSLLFLQHSSSQRGSAVSGSKIVPPHYHFCFYSIPAPKEDLQ